MVSILVVVVESKINDLNDMLNDDCISKKFYCEISA